MLGNHSAQKIRNIKKEDQDAFRIVEIQSQVDRCSTLFEMMSHNNPMNVSSQLMILQNSRERCW